MKKCKKLLVTILSILLMATTLFAGCSSSGLNDSSGVSSSVTESSSLGENSEENPEDALEENTEENTEENVFVNPYEDAEYPEGEEVIIWNQIFEDFYVNSFEKAVHEYNLEGRGYTIREEYIAGGAWDERIATARASGTCPTAYCQSYNTLLTGIKNGYFAPINDYVDESFIDNMVPIVREMVSFDDKVYAFPILCEPSVVLYYRKDLLEAGNYSEPPKTWQELIDMANALKTDDIYGIEVPGFGTGDVFATWGIQYGTSGHIPLTDDWSAPNIDEGYQDIALFFKDLYDTGAVPEQPLAGYTDIKPFGQGDVVFQICGSWGVPTLIESYPEIWENTGIAPMPTKTGATDETTATIGGWAFVLDTKAENPEGAADYFTWLMGPEHPERLGQYFVAAEYSKSSPYQAGVEWLSGQAEDLEYVKTINSVAALGQPEPAYPFDISARITSFFEDVALGYDDLDNATGTLIEDIQQLIDDNGLAGTNPRG